MAEKRIRILFVDDEENNLKAFKATFRRDLDLLLATSGEEALRILGTEEVHVIISDQRMPGMTGSQLLAAVKEEHPNTMRMLLTGYSDLEAVIAAVNDGGLHAYATKPWEPDDLLLRIKQLFEVHQLRESQGKLLHRYQQVFESSGDPIVIVDDQGRITQANSACGKLLGIPVQELLRSNFTDHVENAERLIGSMKERGAADEPLNMDITVRTASGAMLDCLMTANNLGKHDQVGDMFQAMFKDITDRKQEETRLRKLNSDLDKRVAIRTSQLLEALEDIGSFSYTVAHDLRSPLKNIVALSDLLRTHAHSAGENRDCSVFSERIHKGAQRMIDLVDDLLRFSQTNTREMERKEVALAPLLGTVLEDQVPEDRLHQVTMEIHPGTTVLVDAPMLKVVLQNLLSNALKFTRGVPEPRINITHERRGDKDLISVTDNGVGFDPKFKEQAFGAFKRLHSTDQFEGTGVGLAIVHRIVSKHGGEVQAESATGKGTTITVSLLCSGAIGAIPFGKVA